MTPQETAEKLRKEAAEKLAEAELLAKLTESYPDLQKYTGRWNKVAYYSKSVNDKVTRFDLRHNCGCCNDSPLELWPYLETPNGKVYSDPPSFVVGENSYYGDRPNNGWKSVLRNALIPEDIIGAVNMHFKQVADEARESIDATYRDDE